MLSKKITIKLPSGLEARPVALLVQVASQFESSVHVACEDKKVNAKSIMGMMSLGLIAGEDMMTLGLSAGEEIEIIVEGADEANAMEQIEKYLCGA